MTDSRRHETPAPAVTICATGKKGFSKAVAEEKLEQHAAGDRPRRPVRVYLCPLCDTWHLTSAPARE